MYVEHAYFTDRACALAQDHLAARLSSTPSPALAARHLALALLCPTRPFVVYCRGAKKQPRAILNPRGLPMTLGDVSALGDHVSRFGPIHGLPRAGQDGLLARIFEWLADPEETPGGVLADVAEEACEGPSVDWARVEADLGAPIERWPRHLYNPIARVRPLQGPGDPDTLFSFDNPHYLDLVLRNHTHFGARAYEVWRGFHEIALDVPRASCAQLSRRGAEAEDEVEARCRVLRARLRDRVLRWASEAPEAWVAPIWPQLQRLRAAPDDPRTHALLDALIGALAGLTLEGIGVHFLQDNLAGGHLRTDRTAHGLGESRYDHDLDNALGVRMDQPTLDGPRRFVGFGDGALLGPPTANPSACHAQPMRPEEVTACLVRFQRVAMLTTTAASLAAWVLDADPQAPPSPLVRAALPIGPSTASGDLPTPPPPFGYESLLGVTALDLSGGGARVGPRLALLDAVGLWAGWMRSYQVTLLTSTAGDVEVSGAFRFHWRWAARFLVSGGFEVYGGGDEAGDFKLGSGPAVGLNFLPEGWTRAPLEIILDYRLPVRFFHGTRGWFASPFLEGHFLDIGVGLAFM
ncbi:hypothetical protein KKB55_21440 [Myxococcota bacterium]|nr:hypothetical protein [Myxococcota bacterium]MBU1900314.1 hypothetical protein [Myxococcota bacterium]